MTWRKAAATQWLYRIQKTSLCRETNVSVDRTEKTRENGSGGETNLSLDIIEKQVLWWDQFVFKQERKTRLESCSGLKTTEELLQSRILFQTRNQDSNNYAQNGKQNTTTKTTNVLGSYRKTLLRFRDTGLQLYRCSDGHEWLYKVMVFACCVFSRCSLISSRVLWVFLFCSDYNGFGLNVQFWFVSRRNS